MQKSLLVGLTLAILTAFIVNNIPKQDYSIEKMYQIKVQFENFKIIYSKKYSFQEEAFRFKVFKNNWQMINIHNSDKSNTYKMGMNHFGDLTHDQFVYKILTPNLRNMIKNDKIQFIDFGKNLKSSPVSVDWRYKGVVTPVKNQGNCGSCWSFSTTGAFQGAVAMKNKTLNDYSQQQLIDCCAYAKYGCSGCSGSWPEWAMEYVRDAGIMLQKDYPYIGIQEKCKITTSAQKILDHRKPWSQLSNNTETVKQALATLGPLSISVDAYQWQFYMSGVFNTCHDSEINHAVLLVGYQEDGTWIIKNSWSDGWGEKGYIRVANKGSSCLIRNHVIIPHLAA